MATMVKAYAAESNNVVYEFDDGSKEVRKKGTRAWRNQNPGNVRYSKANPWNGQLGEAGGFCVFFDRSYGERAVRIILTKYASRGLTLTEAIHTYAPGSDGNNTTAYIASVSAYSKVLPTTKLNTLTSAQMEKIAQAIFIHEGWQEGEIEVIPAPKEENKESSTQKTGQYIWRTERDKKVRLAHAMREGQIFDWDFPPEGGHPGEAYGCRCWAEEVPENTGPMAAFLNKPKES